jgi:hypothetical protein
METAGNRSGDSFGTLQGTHLPPRGQTRPAQQLPGQETQRTGQHPPPHTGHDLPTRAPPDSMINLGYVAFGLGPTPALHRTPHPPTCAPTRATGPRGHPGTRQMINGPSDRASPRWSPDSHLSVQRLRTRSLNPQVKACSRVLEPDRAVVRRWRGRFVTGACFVEVSPGVEPGYPSHDVCE